MTVTLPEGLQRIGLVDGVEDATKGIFTHTVCKDAGGNCYIHFTAKPKITEAFTKVSGQSLEETERLFNQAFGGRMGNLAIQEGGVLHHADPAKGEFTYKMPDIDLKDIDKVNNPFAVPSELRHHSEAACNLHSRFLDANHNAASQSHFACHDFLNSLPPKDLVPTLQSAQEVLEVGNIAEYLQKNPQALETMEAEFAKGGVKDFRFLGMGNAGMCLEGTTSTGKKVAVMIRNGGCLKRMPIPQHLQPLHAFHAGGLHVEIMPKLNSKSVTVDDLQAVKEGVAGHVDTHGGKYAVNDNVVRNVGHSEQQTLYYFDGDGIDKRVARSATPATHDPRWVTQDGTWQQYEEFKEEHRLFNSPLHQGGGRIIPATEAIAEPVHAESHEAVRGAIQKTTQRLRDRHGVESRIGFEWEFQLLDKRGEPVPLERLQELFKGHDGIGKIYEERGQGLLEIATQHRSPLEAADMLSSIQTRVGEWAREQGYHLSAHPVVSAVSEGEIIGRSGSAGMHVNSSLIKVGDNADSRTSSLFSVTEEGEMLNAKAANVAHSIAQVSSETPLWSHHGKEDLGRLKTGDGTPKAYNVGVDKTESQGIGAVEMRRNYPLPVEGEDGVSRLHIRMEERVGNARIDPHVAAFRTTLGQLDGLEHPVYPAEAMVNARSIGHGDIPKTWDGMAVSHRPHVEGSITARYVGDLYDAETLKAIDEKGRNPHLVAHNLESDRFQWKPRQRSSAASNAAPEAINTFPFAEPVIVSKVEAPAPGGTVDIPPVSEPPPVAERAPPAAEPVTARVEASAPHAPSAAVGDAAKVEATAARVVEKEGVEAARHGGRGGMIAAGVAVVVGAALATWAWLSSKKEPKWDNDYRSESVASAQGANAETDSSVGRSDGRLWTEAVSNSRNSAERTV